MPSPTALFSVAEARAFDKAQLTSATDYPDLTITDKEAEIRQWLEKVCGCNFIPTSHAETYDGDGSDYLHVRWPLITAVTALSIDGVSVDAAYLSSTDYSIGLGLDYENGIVTRRSGTFTAGWSNVLITYTAGYAAVPYLVKRAALRICVQELPTSNVPFAASSYEAGGMDVSFANGDGFNGHWHRDSEVMKVIRMYDHSLPGIA
jgi:hypothetical protein